MRLHTGVSYPLERVVPQGGVEISGHFLPEGTIVGVHPWVIHRDRNVFGADADEFRPERWMGGGEEQIREMDRVFIPVRDSSHLYKGSWELIGVHSLVLAPACV